MSTQVITSLMIAAVVAVFAIWINTKSGKKWVDNL